MSGAPLPTSTVVEIRLGRGGLVALVDGCDAHLAAFKWQAHVDGNTLYARRDCRDAEGKRRRIKLHRVVLGVTDPDVKVDHINGNGLDCRRSNLRIATHSQNLANRGASRTNRSGFKGVYWCPENQRWRACLAINGRTVHLGRHSSAEDAARAYDAAARRYFGDFARLNFPHDTRTA